MTTLEAYFRLLSVLDTLEQMPNIRFGSIVPEKPEASLQTMLEWIKICETTHIACKPFKEPQLPRRVIDVQNWQNSLHPIRLYEGQGECSRYVALSHRWGSNQLLKTTTSSLESRKKAISWIELSQTFQDAIILTAKLGVRYLWIDSLCIIQDSKKDWQQESSKMASIYENAFVTLAANRSEDDSKGGLFAPRVTNAATIQVDFPGRPTISVLVREALKHDQFYEGSENNERHGSYPLFQRAWCFQERILATRILHFTKNEVVFECKTGCKCECTSIGLRGDPFIKAYYQELFAGKYYVNSWAGWRTVVTDYSKNRLTDSRDVLPALSGISSRLQCEELGHFYAGLWEKELIYGLFWYTRVSTAFSTPIYTGPSFSWVSLIGRADFKDLQWTDSYKGSSDTRVPNVGLINVTCWVNGSNPYGEVSKGIVELRARCHDVILIQHPGKRHPKMQVIWKSDPTSPFWDTDDIRESRTSTDHVFLDCGNISAETVGGQQLTCIIGFWKNYKGNFLIKTGTGLVLEKLPHDLLYRRVGYFEGLPYPGGLLESRYGSEKIIKIS